MKRGTTAAALLALAATATVNANTLFTEGFESYTAGANPLDKNVAGANAAPNGSGNPWFGPAPPNARVVGIDSTNGPAVAPHSGSAMIRGSAPSDLDQNWVNIGYRFNGGSAYTGGIQLDYYFYDPLGSGGTDFRDFGALGFYNTAPSSTDYPGTGSLNTGVTQIQRLCLGASSSQGAGFDNTTYQARVVGATDGYSNGWFNTTTPRSVGWHHALIFVSSDIGDGTNNVSFYIDDFNTPTLTHNSVTNYGYNVIELNNNFGPTTGYFDDLTLSTIPEPSSAALIVCGLLMVGSRCRRR
jgi:hypothetical protein